MAAGGAFVIFAGDEIWRVRSPGGATGHLQFERGTGAKTIAADVTRTLREGGYQGGGVLLALPAAWCLSAVISTADLPRNDGVAMAFRLEEKLPLAAENFTADFVPLAEGERALGVCVENDRVVPLVEALEDAGVVVQSVTPGVMLAVQSMTGGDVRHAAEEEAVLLLWGEGADVNVVTLYARRPVGWAVVPADAGALGMQLDMAVLEVGDAAVVTSDLPAEWAAWLAQRGFEDVTSRKESIEDVVVRRATDVLSGALTPWVELRRGAMAIEDPLRVVRRPINAALAAAAVLCVVLAGVFFYRSFRYDQLAQSYEAQLAEDFKREFPGWPVPPNVRRMVESERAKLAGGGPASSSLPAEAQESALRVLHDVLAKIPAESKITIDKINVYDTVAEVQARSKSHADADVLAGALRTAGLDVPPPQMRQREGVWSFVVRGDKPNKTAGAAAAAARGGE